MRGINIMGNCLGRFFLHLFAWSVPAVAFLLMDAANSQAVEPIKVFPETPFDGYIIYESLAILGLIVIIRMKLREIERTQELGVDQEDSGAPLLQ